MILPIAVLLVALSVPLTGGRLRHLGELPLRSPSLVVAAIALQLVITVGTVQHQVGSVLHLASYGLAVAFVLTNRAIRGLLVVGTGGAMNLVAIAANGGVMPASPRALELAGLAPAADSFANSNAVDAARLAWLGDVFAIPAGWPLANVFSLGDLVLVVGIAIVLHRASRPRSAGEAEGLEETTVPPAKGDRGHRAPW